MENYHKGNTAMVDELTEIAVECYTAALDEDPTLTSAHSALSLAYLKLKRNGDALQSAEKALALDTKCEPAFHRKGQACFALENYSDALTSFKAGQTLCKTEQQINNTRQYDMWIRKCEVELNDDAEKKEKQNKQASTTLCETEKAATANMSSIRPTPIGLVRFQHYQTAKNVTISILEKNIIEEETTVEILPTRLRIIMKGNSGRYRNDVMFDRNLFDEIVPEKSKVKFLPMKVECILRKKEENEWPALEGTANDTKKRRENQDTSVVNGNVQQPPTQISRPYSSNKDWNMIEKDVEEELGNEEPEGDEALNALFKDIYQKADEDTRRAMNKSFQTSGGTVLSTNWGEVGEADYEKERKAPKGMEWKTWEGKKLPQELNED
eukprot:268717_1